MKSIDLVFSKLDNLGILVLVSLSPFINLLTVWLSTLNRNETNHNFMFTQMRTSRLKFFEMILFVTVFLISGLLTSTNIVLASSPSSSSTTTVTVLVSCAPGSLDVYDMRTGERCQNAPALIGCKDGSGDLYDVNTGKRCLNTPLAACKDGSGDLYDVNTGKRCTNTPLAACMPGSGDKYDMNTGKVCKNDTSGVKACGLSSDIYNIYTGKLCADKSAVVGVLNPTEKITDKELTLLTPNGQLSGSMTGSDEGTPSDRALASDNLSGRQMIAKSLSASVAKAGSILKGPMSIWIIILIIAILLGGSYAIYELLKKKEKVVTVKQNTTNTKPVIPEVKTQNTPSTPTSNASTTDSTATPPPAQQQMNMPGATAK